MTEKSKAIIKPWFSRILRPPVRKRSGSYSGTYIYLLLTLPWPTWLNNNKYWTFY